MKVLGIDVGERRIGLAISDELRFTARELGVVAPEDFESRLRNILETEEVGKIVVGRPRTMSGDLGPQAQRVAEFVEGKIKPFGREVIWEDETLTSVQAEEELKKMKMDREEIKKRIDAVAARIILQSYLNNL